MRLLRSKIFIIYNTVTSVSRFFASVTQEKPFEKAFLVTFATFFLSDAVGLIFGCCWFDFLQTTVQLIFDKFNQKNRTVMRFLRSSFLQKL